MPYHIVERKICLECDKPIGPVREASNEALARRLYKLSPEFCSEECETIAFPKLEMARKVAMRLSA